MPNCQCKYGFTLAEVLITLGIIGVVAAMTLSTVISKIQDKQNIAKWKKEYSVISNAFNEVVADGVQICEAYSTDGKCISVDNKFIGTPTEEYYSAMMSKLKVIDYCGTNVSDSNKRCDYYNSDWYNKYAKYKWSGVANIYSRYKALGVREEFNPDSNSPYGIYAYNFSSLALLLSDGAVVYFGDFHGGPWIVVDVNNFQTGPNEFGRDVFVIKLFSNIKTDKHYLSPMGAEGTFNKEKNGDVCECSPDKGVKGESSLAGNNGEGEVVSGICCSSKYLLK